MRPLAKSVTIKSFRSQEKVIESLRKNMEPWYKEGSKLCYIGMVNNNGTFKAETFKPNSTRYPRIDVTGKIEETETGSLVHITSSFPVETFIGLLIGILSMPVVSTLSYLKVISIGFPWYVPLVFDVFCIAFFYFALTGERDQVIEDLKWIIR